MCFSSDTRASSYTRRCSFLRLKFHVDRHSRRLFSRDEKRRRKRCDAISSPNRLSSKEKKGKGKRGRRKQKRDKRRETGRSHATYIKRTIITRCIAIRFFSKYTRIHIHIQVLSFVVHTVINSDVFIAYCINVYIA